jgi:hypothetical protein
MCHLDCRVISCTELPAHLARHCEVQLDVDWLLGKSSCSRRVVQRMASCKPFLTILIAPHACQSTASAFNVSMIIQHHAQSCHHAQLLFEQRPTRDVPTQGEQALGRPGHHYFARMPREHGMRAAQTSGAWLARHTMLPSSPSQTLSPASTCSAASCPHVRCACCLPLSEPCVRAATAQARARAARLRVSKVVETRPVRLPLAVPRHFRHRTGSRWTCSRAPHRHYSEAPS